MVTPHQAGKDLSNDLKEVMAAYQSGKGYKGVFNLKPTILVRKMIYKCQLPRSEHLSKFTPMSDHIILNEIQKNPKTTFRDLLVLVNKCQSS